MPYERIEFVSPSNKTLAHQKLVRAMLKAAMITVLSCVCLLTFFRVVEASSLFSVN